MQLMSNKTVAKIDNKYATAPEFRWMIHPFVKGQVDLLSSFGLCGFGRRHLLRMAYYNKIKAGSGDGLIRLTFRL